MYLDERLRMDLGPDMYCLIHNKIVNLEQQCKKQKEVINKIEKYCYKFMECTPRLSEIVNLLKEMQNEAK